MLTVLPAATDDEAAHLLVRALLEDIAVAGAGKVPETDRLRMLAELDRLPVSIRAEVGRFLEEAMEAAARAPAGTPEWRVRWVRGELGGEQVVQLGYGTCSVEHSAEIQDVAASLVRLRHHDMLAVVGDSLVTVMIVLTPRTDGVRPWDTTMLAFTGDPELDDEQLALLRELWPADPPP